MDLIKAKSILARLHAMQSALEVNGQLSALEKDLILNYLRELYSIYLEANVEAPAMLKSMTQAPIVEKPNEVAFQKTLAFQFESEQKAPAADVIPSVAENKPYESILNEHILIPDIAPKIESIEPKPEPIPFPPTSTHTSPAVVIPVSIRELFEIKKGHELTDKLNELPLRDIHRGLGLNDKLEYISILFNNNKTQFDQIIIDLNSLRSFEEAQIHLGQGSAIQYKWDHDDRKEKAIEFIKLIRRRYL